MLPLSTITSLPPLVSTGPYRDVPVFPHHTDAIPPGVLESGAFDLRFAWTRADLHSVQTLRYSVFHDELGEGTPGEGTGRDEDPHDPWFHHLMIVHRASGVVVGTYRLQTAVMAATRYGFYSATLFELGAIPGVILDKSIEVGRACVAPGYRSGHVLRLLWKGLARYMHWNSKRFLFGCCSLPGTDVDVARDAWRILHARGVLHDRVMAKPRAGHSALPDDGRFRPLTTADSLTAPLTPLFDSYLALGAKVCSAPAIDREFGTTDFLVLMDVEELEDATRRSLFA